MNLYGHKNAVTTFADAPASCIRSARPLAEDHSVPDVGCGHAQLL